MRFLTIALAAAIRLAAQMPEVPGKAVDQATLRYVEIKIGEGAPAAAGKQFTVDYTGWLRDGTQFDSSVGKDPLQFVQGRRQVIAGFDVGFEGMKAGGKRRIFIPWQLAYGEQGRGKIPPKAELIFDVELLDVKDAAPNAAVVHEPAPTSDEPGRTILSVSLTGPSLFSISKGIQGWLVQNPQATVDFLKEGRLMASRVTANNVLKTLNSLKG